MNQDALFMQRCFQLARLGVGNTWTNPLVGAVIVYKDRIIGEGYHQAYGGNHGEIEAFKSVKSSDRPLLKESTMYVNLEPCSHQGKTPPCADEIIRQGIRKVVIGCLDPNPKVNGRGIKRLQEQNIEVQMSKLQSDALQLNKVFLKNMTQALPYVVLKFAKSRDQYIGGTTHQVVISNAWSQYVVHKIRHEVDALLIGTNTAVIDNPLLTNRLFYGKNPIRLVWDKQGRIPETNQLFKDGHPTWLFTEVQSQGYDASVKIFPWIDELPLFLKFLLTQGISSILVEGGSLTLRSFITQGLWDEVWCTQSQMVLGHGIQAPAFQGQALSSTDVGDDQLTVYVPMVR